MLNKKIILFVALGLIAFVVYFYFFVGTTNVVDVIEQANLFYYIGAFIAFVIGVFFSCLAWHSLLNSLSVKTSVRRALLFIWVGLFFDATVPDPGWSGDLSKAYMLAKAGTQDSGRTVASVVGQKIISMVITVFTLVLGLILLAVNYAMPGPILTFIVALLFFSIFSLFIVYYISINPKATKTLVNWLIRVASFVRAGHWNSTSFRLKTEEVLDRFHKGILQLRTNPKSLVRPVIFSLMSVSFDVSVVFLTFAALGYPVPVDKVLIVYALTGTLQSVGVALVGFAEIIMSTAYWGLGIPSALSLSATLLTRVVTLWFKLIIAYVAFQWAGIEILRAGKQKLAQQGLINS